MIPLILSSIIWIGPWAPSIYRSSPAPIQRLTTLICTRPTYSEVSPYCYDISNKIYTKGKGRYLNSAIKVTCQGTEFEFGTSAFYVTVTPFSPPYITYPCI